MRDSKRIKRILEKIEKLWNKVPDQRLGQLLINYGCYPDVLSLWNFEDDDFEKVLNEVLKK